MRKRNIIIGVIAIITMIVIFLFCNKSGTESNGVVWTGKQMIQSHSTVEYIAVPGFDRLTFTANQKSQKVNFYNPANNTCSMDMEIVLLNGESIWEIGNIQPGYGLYDIELEKELERGTYEKCKFVVRCFNSYGKELNGCNLSFTLYVR